MSHSHDNSNEEQYLHLIHLTERGETNTTDDQTRARRLQDLRRGMQYSRSTERMNYAPPSESSSSTNIVTYTDQTTTSTGGTTNTTGQPTTTHDPNPLRALQEYLEQPDEGRNRLTEMGVPEREDQDGCIIAAGFVSGMIGSSTARTTR